ncbi:MAG: hypothetical protein ABI806_06340 [Candidatus Solibacter sp.]
MYTVIVMEGRPVEALLLSVSPDRLRVVIPGRADTAEFQMLDGQWTSESGAQVELGAIFSTGAADTKMVMGLGQELRRTAV